MKITRLTQIPNIHFSFLYDGNIAKYDWFEVTIYPNGCCIKSGLPQSTGSKFYYNESFFEKTWKKDALHHFNQFINDKL